MRRFALGIQISFVAPSSGWGGGGGGGRGGVAAAARRRRGGGARISGHRFVHWWQPQQHGPRCLLIGSSSSPRARRAAPRPSRARARARSRPARPASLSPVELDNDAGKSFCLCRVGIIATSPPPAPRPTSWCVRHAVRGGGAVAAHRGEASLWRAPPSCSSCTSGTFHTSDFSDSLCGRHMRRVSVEPLAPPLAPPPRAARRALLPLPSLPGRWCSSVERW